MLLASHDQTGVVLNPTLVKPAWLHVHKENISPAHGSPAFFTQTLLLLIDFVHCQQVSYLCFVNNSLAFFHPVGISYFSSYTVQQFLYEDFFYPQQGRMQKTALKRLYCHETHYSEFLCLCSYPGQMNINVIQPLSLKFRLRLVTSQIKLTKTDTEIYEQLWLSSTS